MNFGSYLNGNSPKSKELKMEKSIQVDKVILSYLDINPQNNKTIFFIHGNSSSANTWKYQFNDIRFNDFRFIAVDLPAHGLSSEDPLMNYGIVDIAKSLSIFLNLLQIKSNVIIVGISLGSNIATEMLHYFKPKGLVLAGPTILGDYVTPQTFSTMENNGKVMFTDVNNEYEVRENFKKILSNNLEEIILELVNDYNKVKGNFRSTMIKEAENGNISNEFELLRNSSVQPLIIFGEDDKMVKTNYLDGIKIPKWENKIYKIKKAGHFVHLDQPHEFNEILLNYFKFCYNL